MASYQRLSARDKMNGHINRMLQQKNSAEKPLKDFCWDIAKVVLEDVDCYCLDYNTVIEVVWAKVNETN